MSKLLRNISRGLWLMIASLVMPTVVFAIMGPFPEKAPSHFRVETDRSGNRNTSTYLVRKRNTQTRIAKKASVPVEEMKQHNTATRIKAKSGQVLVMKEIHSQHDVKQQLAKNIDRRYDRLFSEKDYEQSLSELTDPDPNKTVDLGTRQDEGTTTTTILRATAYGFLGTRYRFGGSSKNGIDCSSFVQQVFRELEVLLPRTAREQFQIGNEVSPGDLQKGDLIFFRTYAHFPSHVGIYLGNNRMIHASSHDHRVVISPMNTQYYRTRFIGAKRIAKINPETFKFDDLLSGIEESPDEAQLHDTQRL
jgi:cell wall-associated NlpC family hydrolase